MNQPPRTIDLRSTRIAEWDDLWDALARPLDLPTWFGRNLDAWWDTIESGDVSGAVDRHQGLIIRVRPEGLFAPGADGERFVTTTNESEHVRIDLAGGTGDTGEGPPVH